MHPQAQAYHTSVSRRVRPQDYDLTSASAMVASFRRGGLEPAVTVAVLAEGFGPGWTAREVCQLGLQTLRNRFVQAEDEPIDDILRSALDAIQVAVKGRAAAYAAEDSVGCRLVVAVVSGSGCWLAQVGAGAGFWWRGGDGPHRLGPPTSPEDDQFLGGESEPAYSLVADRAGGPAVQLEAGDRVLLLNTALAECLTEEQIDEALGRSDLDRAADRLLKLGQAEDAERELALVVVEISGAVQRAAAILPRFGRIGALGLGALVFVGLLWGGIRLLAGTGEPAVTATPTRAPTATIFLPPAATGLPLLPTPFRTATLTATPTGTATPTATATNTPTAAPPTETVTPTETSTSTSVPPAPTQTSRPSPTVPAVPIAVGGRVIVVGTDGLGVSLRAGPGPGYDRLLIVYDGEELVVIGGPESAEGFVWWQLETAGGIQGWSADRYLQGVAAP